MQYFKNLWDALFFRVPAPREQIVTVPFTKEQLERIMKIFPQPKYYVNGTVEEFAYAQGQHSVVEHLVRERKQEMV